MKDLREINEKNISTNRNQVLDAYKGILIILVVIRHVLQYSVVDEGGILTNIIWGIQMPGFVLVAGYFSNRKIENVRDLGRRILKSMQCYAMPFFSWYLLSECIVLGYHNPIKAISDLMNRIDKGLWFLWVIFVLSIIASICDYLLNKSFSIVRIAIALSMFLVLLIILGKCYSLDFIGVKLILYYSIFFGIGWLCHQMQTKIQKCYTKFSEVIVFISLILYVGIVYNFDLYHSDDHITSIVLRIVAGIVGNVVLLWCCSQYRSILCKTLLPRVGMYTLEIYCVHVQFVQYITIDGSSDFLSLRGLASFTGSIMLCGVFTVLVIILLKRISLANWLFFGKLDSKSKYRSLN